MSQYQSVGGFVFLALKLPRYCYKCRGYLSWLRISKSSKCFTKTIKSRETKEVTELEFYCDYIKDAYNAHCFSLTIIVYEGKYEERTEKPKPFIKSFTSTLWVSELFGLNSKGFCSRIRETLNLWTDADQYHTFFSSDFDFFGGGEK